MKLERKLQDLQEIHASKLLRDTIHAQTASLPNKHTGFYFPLIAFNWGIALAGLIILVSVGGGVMLGISVGPKTPLHPVPVALDHIVRPTSTVGSGTITQAKVPTPTVSPTPQQAKPTPTPMAIHMQSSLQTNVQNGKAALRRSFEKIRTFFVNEFGNKSNKHSSSSQKNK